MSDSVISPEIVEELCHGIQNPERIYRQNALKKFHEILHLCKAADEIEALPKYFDSSHLFILKCYSDKYEICRSLSCLVVNAFLEKLPDNDFYLEVIIPMITKRIGMSEIIEDSEEMRLDLLEQVMALIQKYRAKSKKEDRLLKSYNNIIDILVKTLQDPYPAIQKRSCEVMVALASEKCFHFRAEVLAKPLIGILGHRHSQNRIAAIEALGHLCLNIYTNSDCISNIIMQISPSLMDSMAHVRRQCGRVGCLLLLKLRDRYSFFEKLMPLVLCCLSDENEEIRSDIEPRWIECGELYYNENEVELGPKRLVDDVPANYMPDVKRPTLGCRAIVQRSLRMLNIILYEMEEWKDEVRLHSLKLLRQMVIHCEKSLTVKFIEIYPVLAKSCGDQNSDVAAEAVEVSRMMGILLEFQSWKEHGLEPLRSNPHLGYLKCFTALYMGSGEEKTAIIRDTIKVLSVSRIAYSNKPAIQNQLLQLLQIFIEDYKKDSNNVDDNTEQLFYHTLMNIISLSMLDSPPISENGAQILQLLLSDVSALHRKYLAGVIDSIEGLDSLNSSESEPILLLSGYLRFCGFQEAYIGNLQSGIKTVLNNAQPEGQIKVLTAVAIATLNWNVKDESSLETSTDLLRNFINEIVLSCLEWKVGRSAESIRSMGAAVLCAISENAVEETKLIFPDLITKITPLIEDNNIATRNYSLRSLLAGYQISPEHIKDLGIAVVSRLDDPSSEIRVLAARCIGKLRVDGAKPDEHGYWKMTLKHTLNISMHHFDDPDIALRTSLYDSLKELGAIYKPMLIELIEDKAYSRCKAIELLKEDLVAKS